MIPCLPRPVDRPLPSALRAAFSPAGSVGASACGRGLHRRPASFPNAHCVRWGRHLWWLPAAAFDSTLRALSCPPRWGCEADTASWGGWHAPTRFAVRRQHPMRVTGEVGTCGLMIGDGWMRITLHFSASFPCAAACFPGNRRFSRHTRTKTRKSIIRKNEEKRGNRRKSKHSICILKKFQKWVDIRFAL